MTDCNISIIIPFLNEADSINNLVNELNTINKNINLSLEVIFVDDGSIDQSVELLKNHSQINFKSQVIKLSKNYGSHAALRAGISIAKSDYIGFLYADLQDPVDLIKKMYDQALNSNSNIVWATRNSTDNNYIETLFSRLYAHLMKKFVSKSFPSKGFDIVLFDQKVQKCLNENLEANSSIFLQILTLGFKQTSISYDKKSRKKGESKWTLSKKIKLTLDSFLAFSYFPIKAVTIIGITFFLIGLAWTSYLVIRTILYNDLELGWPSLISILLLGFGITNISLGVLAEYLWRTLDASRKRPIFIIDEINQLNQQHG